VWRIDVACGLLLLQQMLMQEFGVPALLTGVERSLPGRALDAGPGLEALLGLLRSVSRAIVFDFTCYTA
jgi:hypothetical protein